MKPAARRAHLLLRDKASLHDLAWRLASHPMIPPNSISNLLLYYLFLAPRVSGAMQAALSCGRLAISSTGGRTAHSTMPQERARVQQTTP
jgi:hypothetical protein